MCTLYITHVHCVKKHVYYYTPIINDAIHSATVLLYHTHSHPHYRILMGIPPPLPQTPSLTPQTIYSSPSNRTLKITSGNEQFLLDFTHTHTQTVNKHTHVCNVYVLGSVAGKNLRCFLQVLCMIMAGYLCTLVHEGFQHMYSLVVRSNVQHTHSLAHTRHTHTQAATTLPY